MEARLHMFVFGFSLGGLVALSVSDMSNKNSFYVHQVKQAESKCKQGEWVKIDKSVIYCKDGAEYKLDKEDKL